MLASHTTKPAAADTANGLRNVDLAWRPIDEKHSLPTLQAQRLADRFRISHAVAGVVARAFFGEVAA